jgi:hypothetical protein
MADGSDGVTGHRQSIGEAADLCSITVGTVLVRAYTEVAARTRS